MTHYATLGIMPGATEAEIRKAGRLMLLKFNTDHGGKNTEQYAKVVEAFDVLKTPDKRAEYDARYITATAAAATAMPIATPSSATHLEAITKDLHITLEQVYTGTLLPINIERTIENLRTEQETIYVTIDRGVDDGEIIVIAEKGHICGGVKGDVRVRIHVNVPPNSAFRRAGIDIIYSHSLSLKEALCGFTLSVPHLSGKPITIGNNCGRVIAHGYRQILRERGFVRGGYTGNFIIEWTVRFPDRLSAEAIKTLREIL